MSVQGEHRNLWMEIHRLASAVQEIGSNREERINAAIDQFMDMPPTVRRELHNDVRMLAVDLFDMLPLIASVEMMPPTRIKIQEKRDEEMGSQCSEGDEFCAWEQVFSLMGDNRFA
jgi:hypothetical protein